MDNQFEIPVNYRNQDLLVPATLQVMGYTYRIVASLGEVELYFERDDAGDFRAILAPETPATAKVPDAGLVQAVTEALSELLA